MASGLTPEHIAAARAVARALAGAVKSVDAVIRGYTDDITRNMLDLLDGDTTRGDAARAHRSYIARDAEAAFSEGLIEGGVTEPELSDEDRAEIKAWIADQRAYVSGFWDDVAGLAKDRAGLEKTAYNARLRALYDRITLWESAIRELAGKGKASALKDMMCTWKLGATEEHCSTCKRLNGQRHRLRWFTDKGYVPQQNGSDTLDCGGWRCLCILADDKGKQVLPA